MLRLKSGLVILSFGALALSACGEKAETTTTKTTTTTVTRPATDVVRKAGLWEQTTTAEGMGPATTRICLGESVAPCPGATVAKTADGYTVSATCTTPNGKVAVDGTAKGDLASAYTLTSKATISGSAVAELNKSMTTTTTLKWTGPCPEGMAVGEQQTDEGTVIDMSNFDAAKARAMAKEAAGK